MIALAEKNLKYDSVMISFSKKEHKTNQELKQLNPRQQVIKCNGVTVLCRLFY